MDRLVDGKVKNVRTRHRAVGEEVINLTTINLEFVNLDPEILDRLAMAEYAERYLTVDLQPYARANPSTGELVDRERR